MARVLFLSFDGLTDPLGQSQILPYVTGLAARGHEMGVVSLEKVDRRATTGKRVENLLAGYGIRWWAGTYRSTGLLRHAQNLRQLDRLAHRALATENFELIHARSYLAGWAAFRQKKYPWIFDMRGLWPDERRDAGLWRRNNPAHALAYRLFKVRERRMLRHCDGLVSLTQRAVDWLESARLISRETPRRVIPCSVDLAHFDPQAISTDQRTHLRRELDLGPGQTVLIYVGSVGTWYDLPGMLRFFSAYRDRYPDAVLLVLSPPPHRAIREAVRRAGLAREAVRIRFAEREEVPAYLALARAGMAFVRPFFSKIAASPTKVAEMLAMGLPVVALAGVGDLDDFFEEKGGGVLLPDSGAAACKTGVYALASLPSQNCRELAAQHFSLKNALNAYDSLYKEILSNR